MNKGNNNLKSVSFFLDMIGLTLIGLTFIGYVLHGSNFAEINIQFSFLNFPVFIGEILLFICLICFVGTSTQRGVNLKKLNKWHWLIIGYFSFVLIKAFLGYRTWGPLAFRHAALFYYPVFAVFGYTFYRKEYFANNRNLLILIVIIFFLIYFRLTQRWLFSCFILSCILIKKLSNKNIKWFLLVLLFLITPYRDLFRASRMMMVSNFVASIFLIVSLIFFVKFKKIEYKVILIIGGILIVSVAMYRFADGNALKTIVNLNGLKEAFEVFDARVQAGKKDYKMKNLKKVQIYNKNIYVTIEQVKTKVRSNIVASLNDNDDYQTRKNSENKRRDVVEIVKNISTEEIKNEVIKRDAGVDEKKVEEAFYRVVEKKLSQANQKQKNFASEKVVEEIKERAIEKEKEIALMRSTSGMNQDKRDIKGAYNSAVFRLLIWRDMFEELWNSKPIFGFAFGKPLRSISLEIIEWGGTAWERDGWIAAHNSFFHIIYRAGLIGIFLIFINIGVLMKMYLKSLKCRSLIGILLCAIIVNWLVAANFLLILELPYTAIPIWTIYGVTFAYISKLKLPA